jgi:hypothetical protein
MCSGGGGRSGVGGGGRLAVAATETDFHGDELRCIGYGHL